MKLHDYVFSLLFFVFLLVVIQSMDLRQSRHYEALHQEITALRDTVKVNQDTLLVNVKKPVWWR